MEFENMEIPEMNKCLSKFYVSARKKDGSNYKKTSLMSIRAALDHHLWSEPHNKTYSICDAVVFNEANKTLYAYLKHLVESGKIAGTVHKNSLTAEAVQQLFEKGELTSAETSNPRGLLQTVWFYISLYFDKRGRENQSVLMKSMLRLCITSDRDEYFELNKDEPGTLLSSKNHTGGLEGTEDHADGKIFAIIRQDVQLRPLKRTSVISIQILTVYFSDQRILQPSLILTRRLYGTNRRRLAITRLTIC